MMDSVSGTTWRGEGLDETLLYLDTYIKDLSKLKLKLEAEVLAGNTGLTQEEQQESDDSSYERHRTHIVEQNMKELTLERSELAHEEGKLQGGLAGADGFILELLEKNHKLCKEILQVQQEIGQARRTLEEKQQEWKRRRLGKEKPPTEERGKDGEEMGKQAERLKVLNNVFLQLLLSSETDWAQDETLRDIVHQVSNHL